VFRGGLISLNGYQTDDGTAVEADGAGYGGGYGLESRHLESRPKEEARLDQEGFAGWVGPYSRGP
jgi:hypothetical protein